MQQPNDCAFCHPANDPAEIEMQARTYGWVLVPCGVDHHIPPPNPHLTLTWPVIGVGCYFLFCALFFILTATARKPQPQPKHIVI